LAVVVDDTGTVLVLDVLDTCTRKKR